ncbi:MAG TPA: arginine--tRNA ligase [Syntrophales bacterium]|nr:arginine--tRNA ligase [Syntrophales bacterium]HOL58810.1 arginine--tRNA ligase [Syntrophales bacterium]HPO35137.1 arginine--tRNA ligase [Syntrophales bacterium]
MRRELLQMIEEAIGQARAVGLLPEVPIPDWELTPAKEEAHGDYASNVALVTAPHFKMPPRKIAEIIVANLKDKDRLLKKAEIAGPGFINFFLNEEKWLAGLFKIHEEGENWGRVELGHGQRVQVEFVSANPTGPLHIGHARGAVVGDVIARILTYAGYEVWREYYINDAGNQMHTLGRSVLYRYRELAGEVVAFPENCYQGDYIRDLAREVFEREGKKYLERPEEELIPLLADYAARKILEGIKDDLKAFGVVFDCYFSEKELYRQHAVEVLLQELTKKGYIYEEDGSRWFRSTLYGDDKDRVVVRRTGEPTYFAADLAYHLNKLSRGFEKLIDIWGADHHGYVPRIKAGMKALGYEEETLRVILVQLVNLLRDGVPVAMSTRSGEFVTLREVIDEVGKDAARYNFLMRRSDSHLDFDLAVAKSQSMENPVYYVQYAHARICSILRMAEERGFEVPDRMNNGTYRLNLPEEQALIKAAVRFPEVVEGAARMLEPHRITFYLNEIAGLFHSYYNRYRVLTEEVEEARARLYLIKALRTVFKNGLNLLGVSAPERM